MARVKSTTPTTSARRRVKVEEVSTIQATLEGGEVKGGAVGDGAASPFSRVRIIGAGGVGFWLAVAFLHDNREVDVEVWDDDTFEGGNGYRRLPPAPLATLPKVNLLKWFSTTIMEQGGNDQKVEFISKKWGGEGEVGDLIIDCTDMAKSTRSKLWEKARAGGAICWRISYDGNGVTACAPGLPLVGSKGGGYERVPTTAQSFRAGGIGAEVVSKLLKGEEVREFQVVI